MKFTKSAIMLTIWAIIFFIILIYTTNLFNAQQKYESNHFSHINDLLMTNNSDHLLWFLQISDIHISVFEDQSRITDFQEFCENVINVFKPEVVIASGDLTDGRTSRKFPTQQIKQEWIEYDNVLTSLNISQHTTWLDIRGNHDSFNVLHVKSDQNYFTDYSVQGKANPRSYLFQLKKGTEIYSFIAVDATLQPGPRFPFNFVGSLDDSETNVINNLVKEIESSDNEYTIWFGHYPTSCILNPKKIRSLIGKHKQGLAYLCGHLHRIVPQMYTIQKEGFLELELSDWKNNRMFRLLSIDHGLLSFVDVKHQDWPVILITNPKHTLFITPHRENVDTIKQSTHIRILIFSVAVVESVKHQIDNGAWVSCQHVDGPLYVAAWDPNMYSLGLHKIKVHVQDVRGRNKYHTQPFSLDDTMLSFGFFPNFLLQKSAHSLFKLMFWTLNVLILTPLLLLKLIHYLLIKNGTIDKREKSTGCVSGFFRKFWILSSVNHIFWPLVLYQVYVMIGPWSIGYIIEDCIGAIFAWGIYVNGIFLPGSFTYNYGLMQLILFQIPLIVILAHVLDYRIHPSSKNRKRLWCLKLWLYIPFLMILAYQFTLSYFYLIAYGALACFLCPIHTWTIFFAIVLYLLCYHF